MKSFSSSPHIYDYIVVGAGISGLQSLEVLTKKTKNVLALESQNLSAGRILSESLVSLPGAQSLPWVVSNRDKLKNVFIEKGATWIEERHKYLLQICKKFGIEIREQHSSGNNIYLYNGQSLTVQQLKKNPKIGPELKTFLDQIDHLSQVYNKYVLTPNENKVRGNRMLAEYDTKLVSEYLEEGCLSKEVEEIVENFLEHTECVSCHQNSMHEVLTKNARSNDVGILREFLGHYKEDQHEPSYLINKGTYQLINKFLQEIEKQMGMPHQKFILFNERVFGINNSNPNFCVVTTLNTKTSKVHNYICRKVLLTLPLAVSRTLTISNISKAKRFILDNQLRTTCLKSFLIVKKPFWRRFASGDAIFSNHHLVNMCHDISPTDQSCGIMVFFHNGRKYDQWQSIFKSQPNEYQAKKKYIIDLTCQLFRVTPQQKKLYLQDSLYYISSFMQNEYIRSGFQSCTNPGTFSTIIKYGQNIDAFYRDQNNIYFIGSEYSKEFASYIQGAIRVAREKCYKLIGMTDELFQKEIKGKGKHQPGITAKL